jgi:hypothetical protein
MRNTRNILLALGIGLLLAFAGGGVARAQDDDGGVMPGFEEITPRAKNAIDRGLEYLARHQNPEGYWIEMIGRKVNEDYRGHMGRNVGVTAIACMSFLAGGSTPGRGPFGDNVERGLEWLLDQVDPADGFIHCDQSRMYEHAFATLFLAEVYGMTGDERVKPKLEKAVSCIVQSQNAQGGWRYIPGAKDSDMSIVVTCVMALRGARNVGIYVPKDTIDQAIAYVKRSYIGGPSAGYMRGGFWYQNEPFHPSRTSFALTAAGVAALYAMGEYDAPEIREGLRYMQLPNVRPPHWRATSSFDYYYGHYYAIQCFYQAGGEAWARWYPDIREEILNHVNRDGSWEDLVGKNYATAMATLILQIPYRYLPIFER